MPTALLNFPLDRSASHAPLLPIDGVDAMSIAQTESAYRQSIARRTAAVNFEVF